VSPLAQNGGFDDVAAKVGWSFPATLVPGNWAQLEVSQPGLAALGNVQCESCHGPQFSDGHPFDTGARISWSAEVCASCHQEAPMTYAPSQWSPSKHADPTLAMQVGTVEGRPNGGAAHCARCHTAQGFARYARQLENGYAGWLTTDGLPPANADAGAPSNAATDAWLTSIGLTRATVQPQTCAACHDPHDATNPAQLRLSDGVPGLPNGQATIAKVGAGMVCMACHNSRNGEADDFTPPPPAISGPHDGPQTDVLFGVNAYFVPKNNPSPHLAVKDTCVGCHYGAPTAAQQTAHQTSNHSFVADLTICTKCHSDRAIDGAAIQRATQARLDALDTLVYAKVGSSLAAAVSSFGSYALRAQDPATGYFSSTSTSASNVTLSAAPVSIARPQPVPQHGGLATLILTLASPITFEGYDAAGHDAGSVTTSTIAVSLASVKANGAPVFPGSHVIAKAIWNEQMLHNDGTLGIHNLPFTQSVIDATTARLEELP
jgi:hypothetical protein